MNWLHRKAVYKSIMDCDLRLLMIYEIGEKVIDNYTKIILTVIAVATSVIALQGTNLIKTATAEGDQLLKVAICDYEYPTKCADVINTMNGYSLVGYSSNN